MEEDRLNSRRPSCKPAIPLISEHRITENGPEILTRFPASSSKNKKKKKKNNASAAVASGEATPEGAQTPTNGVTEGVEDLKVEA